MTPVPEPQDGRDGRRQETIDFSNPQKVKYTGESLRKFFAAPCPVQLAAVPQSKAAVCTAAGTSVPSGASAHLATSTVGARRTKRRARPLHTPPATLGYARPSPSTPHPHTSSGPPLAAPLRRTKVLRPLLSSTP